VRGWARHALQPHSRECSTERYPEHPSLGIHTSAVCNRRDCKQAQRIQAASVNLLRRLFCASLALTALQ
jgi:hypothetical protein